MTLQASGRITLRDIADEFNVSNNVRLSLTDFYRGGRYVPEQLSSIPREGRITLSDFYGVENATPLTVSFVADDKPYDNSDAATGTLTLEGVRDEFPDVSVEADSITFSSSALGTHSVTASGLTLTGDDADFYYLPNDFATDEATITGQEFTLRAGRTSFAGRSYQGYGYNRLASEELRPTFFSDGYIRPVTFGRILITGFYTEYVDTAGGRALRTILSAGEYFILNHIFVDGVEVVPFRGGAQDRIVSFVSPLDPHYNPDPSVPRLREGNTYTIIMS